MKKFVFSILIASFAIHATAKKTGKLPAIVIDTLYEKQGALVVEYEVLRSFDRVHLTVQSSWEQTIKDVIPILLSGNTGKGKANVAISLPTDEATHFNVCIAGHQFTK